MVMIGGLDSEEAVCASKLQVDIKASRLNQAGDLLPLRGFQRLPNCLSGLHMQKAQDRGPAIFAKHISIVIL
jgi:hypothetical protein